MGKQRRLAEALLSKTRAIVRLLNVYALPESDEILDLITNLDLQGLKEYVKRPLEQKTFDDLRVIASAHHIIGYSRMTRTQLLTEIKHVYLGTASRKIAGSEQNDRLGGDLEVGGT